MASDAENKWAKMWFSTQRNYALEEATKPFSVLETGILSLNPNINYSLFSDNAKEFEKQYILGLESKMMERQNIHFLVNQMYFQALSYWLSIMAFYFLILAVPDFSMLFLAVQTFRFKHI